MPPTVSQDTCSAPIQDGFHRRDDEGRVIHGFRAGRMRECWHTAGPRADRHFVTETAELGPIDAQLRKLEEVGERTSGLTPIQATNFLAAESAALFAKHFRELRFSEEWTFSTKMAADLAAHMTIGLLSPLYQQIDPIRLAEAQRQVRVISDYGERIGKANLKILGSSTSARKLSVPRLLG